MSFGLHLLDWLVVGLYIVGVTALGWWAHLRVENTGDYFLAGRRFGRLAMVTQAFGTGTRTNQAVAVIGASAQLGLAGIWYQWIYLMSTPFFWLIAPVYRRLRYVTLGDFFEQRYGAALGAFYPVVGLGYFAANIGLFLKSVGVTLEAVTGGAVPAILAVFAVMAFFVTYGLLGGLVAIGRTHAVQGRGSSSWCCRFCSSPSRCLAPAASRAFAHRFQEMWRGSAWWRARR